MSAESDTVLAIRSVTKRFPGVTALDSVSLEVRRHEVVGLIGENGSGKSTLLKIISGVQQPDAGSIEVRGREVSLGSPAAALAHGIGMVYQEQSLVPALTVAENIFLGMPGTSRFGVYRWRDLRARAAAELAGMGLRMDPKAVVEEFSFAQRQMLEITRVMQLGRRSGQEPVVILDEPTSVLERGEIDILFAQIQMLRQAGSVIFVSHRLDEVLAVADRVYVLRDGHCVAEAPAKQASQAELLAHMVGRQISDGHYSEEEQVPYDEGEPVLRADGLSAGPECREVSFELHKGEVLGIAGVIGSGREELCRALFGAVPVRQGRVYLDGRPVRFRSPAAAARAGIGYLPSERRIEGAVLGMSVAENMVLAAPSQVSRGPFLARRHWLREVDRWCERLRIKAPKSTTSIGLLSGGNQQKVVLAKWMLKEDLRVLILDHPARGLDIGAKQEVYRLIRDLAKAGLGVILIADTLEEVISLSHTVLVMKDGVVQHRLDAPRGAKPDQVEIVEHMV
jgi:ribose transport system ATP-binding protein